MPTPVHIHNFITPSPALVRALVGLLLGAVPLRALDITDYSPGLNDRFAFGFPGLPVANGDPDFVGAGYDFSGVGWVEVTGGANARLRNLTLISPRHAAYAYHFRAATDTLYRFVGADGSILANTLLDSKSASSNGGDACVAIFQRAFTTDEHVAVYRVLDLRDRNPAGQPALIYGSERDTAPRVGTAIFSGTSVWTSAGTSGSATGWMSGDSGSPAFLTYTAPDGTRSLHLAGTAYSIGSVASMYATQLPQYTTTATVSNDPARDFNNTLKVDGYAIKWTIYDNPSDSANTAAQWTGPTGGDLFAPGNWSLSTGANGPEFDSILLDSGAIGATTPTTLQVNASRTLRGILFKSSTNENGFVFSGDQTLAIARVGIRNESAATQTFDTDIALADSQNWEAAGGDLVFNRTIDTTAAAHLLVVGGAHDTLIGGAITGAGALAKDDAGTLRLQAANTYVGKTWIHDGVIRLDATGAALPASTEVVFDTAAPRARLDLNGHDQTLAGLRSEYDGTGHVEFGNGATLTLDIAANNLTTAGDFKGAITGAGTLLKTGAGVITLSGPNTLDGTLHVHNGVLRIADALPAGANILLSSETSSPVFLDLPAGDFAATLGSAAGQVSITGNAGFGVHGGDLRLTFNNGATLEVGATDFSAVVLGSAFSDGTVELTNNLHLSATRNFRSNNGSAAVDARLSGDISGNGGFAKNNGGVLELTGNNTYAGATSIYSGALRIGNAQALSAATNIVLSGGVLELGHSDYQATLGSGTGQIRFNTGGGFSAAGGDRSVTLNEGAALTWGQNSFVADGQTLMFSSTGADATVIFTNSINLDQTGSGARTIAVANGSAAVDARLSGDITGGVDFVKNTANGTLELTGNNSWTGSTRVLGGALRISSAGALPALGNLELNNAVLELGHSDYEATLGSGPGQLLFTGHGGFSAAYADRVVTLNGGATLSWASGGDFLTTARTLILSSDGSDATITLANAIYFGTTAGTRTIRVDDGSAAVDARLSGNLTGTPGTLVKTGAGTLELTGTNTQSGILRIDGGTVRVSSANAISASTQISLLNGVLELASGDYAGSVNTSESGDIVFERTTGATAGFSAIGANRAVNLNNGAELSWGGSYPHANLPSSFTLLLSSVHSDATIDFRNPLLLRATGSMERTVNVTDGSAGIDARLSGVIRSTGGDYGLRKTGSGTLELGAANTYAGETLVEEGRLLINGDQSAATGRVLVESGATLGGSGTIGGATHVLAGAMLAPGSGPAPATLTFANSLDLEAGSTLHILLASGGTLAGTDHDFVNVAGTTNLGGATLDLELGAEFGNNAQTGLVYALLSTSDLHGHFAQDTSLFVVDEDLRYAFEILYFSSGVSLMLTNISAVPEPATGAILAALTVVAFTTLRRRRTYSRDQVIQRTGGTKRLS